jgi:hopanoid biosynthesis associated radical SAM protein HpnH
MVAVASYVFRHLLRGNRRYPLVLMLEPLYRCNLACAGCGKIQYPSNILKAQLSVEECMRAVDECPAPVVSIAGGEPLLHPEIDRIVAGLVERKKYVYLCTNALLLEDELELFTPSRYLSFSVHLDGLEAEHDFAVCREGTYAKATRAIRAAVARGFRVTTNTTLYEGTDSERTRQFFDEAMRLGVEGMMISPGYRYDKAPDQEHFLSRERTRDLFRRIFAGGVRWRFNQSPLFLEFLTGARDYDCTPWGNPTYSVFGWQKPCYLLQDGYAKTFRELIAMTEWKRYGHRSGNPKCRDCMVHSGFEASAIADAFSSPRGMLAMLRALLFGPRVPLPGEMIQPASGRGGGASSRARRALPMPASADALREAFEYRGDVILALDDGTHVEGYVANLNRDDVEIWTRGSTSTRCVPAGRIRTIAFTGRDMADPGGP